MGFRGSRVQIPPSRLVALGRTIRRVEALRSGRVLAFERDGAAVRFELPAVTDYEVVAIT
jgi:hypothetical protein